ncbi:unnamed protein product, partial [marine sediment metagenome]
DMFEQKFEELKSKRRRWLEQIKNCYPRHNGIYVL